MSSTASSPASSHVGSSRLRAVWHVLAGVTLLAGLVGCGGKESAAAAPGPGGAAPPPPKVGVLTVQLSAVPLATELPGRVEASRTAQVRARVNGVVLKRLFQEGTDVKAGQPLFEIDPAPYRAALASAQAQLARAQANLTQTAGLVTRYQPLRAANAISQQEFANAQAGQGLAEADVAAAKAAIQTAQISLGYATVRAPIAGRIGRALVTEGALASQTEATPLAVIQQVNPVYINVTQPVTQLARLREQLAAGRASPVGDSVPVQVLLEDGRPLGRAGKLLFSDLSVDATSGQVLLRAEVPNTDMALLPGQYVRVQLAQARIERALLVPQQAVTRGPQGDTLYVVGADNQPAARKVKIDSAQNGQWVVLEGLQAGEKVVVDGFQKMKPGAPVQAVPWPDPAASAPPAAAATQPASASASAPAAATATASAPAASR
ncbi:MAG: efflux RND transporter periplasmic adaptor subunit [Pseudomonadota bacterium]